jgi:hypothetical protein
MTPVAVMIIRRGLSPFLGSGASGPEDVRESCKD